MGSTIGFFVFLALSGSVLLKSIRIVREGDQVLVERLGRYSGRKLEPGLNLMVPFLDEAVHRQTIRERVLDIPPQKCITRDNVSISVDAVVYWRIMDLEKAAYKVENLQDAIVNLVLTQIRAEIGQLELDETFTARSEINEILLRELDIATDPWGVKVTRVELRDIAPSKDVQDSMELQMSAERRKRAAILTSEGEKDAAINSARGKAESHVLAAKADQEAVVLRAQAEQKERVLKARAIAESLKIITEQLKSDPTTQEALQFLMAQQYMEMGTQIGLSGSSKVMFMDPKSIPATVEGMRAIIDNPE
ncbi:MAG: SPFH domain-containing protein [Cyanobacteria bacterium P01_A01_bin.135]